VAKSRGDLERLKDLDLRISKAETRGDRESLEPLLTPAVAYRGANGAFFKGAEFIAARAANPQRQSHVLAIDMLSRDQASVSSVVKTADTSEGNSQRLDDVRVYVRDKDRDD
jgi:hypothetical protein